jgi:2-polyprenyl-3-methyl-5-hydroxy-6-metoxy-1,4-benzoquinol methylase
MTPNAEKFWDKQARRYDKSERQFADAYTSVIAKTSRYLDATDHVLDFGCATGTKTMELARKVKHIHGLDISTEMIREALKKKEAARVLNTSFSQGIIFSAELQSGSFDKIITFAVLHLLEDPEKAVRRIHELLKPGGLFISVTSCFKERMTFRVRLQVNATLLMKKLGLIPLHVNLFKADDIVKLMVDQGFKIVETEMIFYGMSIFLIVAEKAN